MEVPEHLILQHLRQTAGKSQMAMAIRFGCGQSSISLLERGEIDELPDGTTRDEYREVIEELAAVKSA